MLISAFFYVIVTLANIYLTDALELFSLTLQMFENIKYFIEVRLNRYLFVS